MELFTCLLNLLALLLSMNAHANDASAMTPSGTPSPAPRATSCDPLDEEEGFDEIVGQGDVEEEFAEADSVVTLARAACPARISASSSSKLSFPNGQTMLSPSITGVPQQYLDVPFKKERLIIDAPISSKVSSVHIVSIVQILSTSSYQLPG